MALASPTPADNPVSFGLVVADGRPADIVAFDTAAVDFFVASADLLGVPKSVAAIYGIVFASSEPLSFSDIEARLDISKGSISQGLNVLRETGAVKAVQREGDRRDYFEPDLEMRKLIERFLENRLQRQLESGRQRLKDLKHMLPNGSKGGRDTLAERLKSLEGWHHQARALLPVAKTFLKLT